VATLEECEEALHKLAARADTSDAQGPHRNVDRSLTCTLPDLGVVFAGKLEGGRLRDIRQVSESAAQIRLEMSSDDLVRLVDGKLNLGSAWATGRVRVHAGVRDLLLLRSMF
jgi:hypothetical protein